MTPITAANKIRRMARLQGLRIYRGGCCHLEPTLEVRATRPSQHGKGNVIVRGHNLHLADQLNIIWSALSPSDLDATNVSIEVWSSAKQGDDYGAVAFARIFGSVSGYFDDLRRVPDLRALHVRPGHAAADAWAAAAEISWSTVASTLTLELREVIEGLSAEWSGTGPALLAAATALVRC